MSQREDVCVWGWDSTPGIVSVWAEIDGRATVWRRVPGTGQLVREEQRFRPWLVLDRVEDLHHLGERLGPEGCEKALITCRELDGPGSLRYLVSAEDGRKLISAVLDGATRRLGQRVSHLRDLGKDSVLALAPEEQYLDRGEAVCRQLAARARAHVRAVRPRGAAPPPARSGGMDAKHAQLLSAFVAATRSGDLHGLTQLLAHDLRVVTDGGGKAAAALNVIDGDDRAARFLVGATRKGWREDFTLRFATINGLPGVIVDGPDGPVQTAAFKIEGGVIRALYVVRNPDKLRHVAAAVGLVAGGG